MKQEEDIQKHSKKSRQLEIHLIKEDLRWDLYDSQFQFKAIKGTAGKKTKGNKKTRESQ